MGQYTRKVAPWPDFLGNEIREGDRIIHPDGKVGEVVFLTHEWFEENQWRVDYGAGDISRLCIQVGEKGRARVVGAARDKAQAHPRITSIDMATEGPGQHHVTKIRVVFDNDRFQSVMVAPSLSPVDVADALTMLARRIREDPELWG